MGEDIPDKRTELLEALIQEMTAVWAYLYAYVGLFEHIDPRRMKLLEKADPNFFALVHPTTTHMIFPSTSVTAFSDAKGKTGGSAPEPIVSEQLPCRCQTHARAILP
ncbi:MAG: hypothetical protein ACWGKN_10975 [Desulfoprunum sp.]